MKWNRSDLLRLLPWGLLGLALIFFAALGFSSEEAAGCTVSISADGSHLGDLLTTSTGNSDQRSAALAGSLPNRSDCRAAVVKP